MQLYSVMVLVVSWTRYIWDPGTEDVVTKVRCLARIRDRLLSAVSARSSAASSSRWNLRTRVTDCWDIPSCKETHLVKFCKACGPLRSGGRSFAKTLATTCLFLHLSLVNADFLVGLVECVLEQGDVLLVFLALDDDFLDGAFLLAEDLDCFRVPPLFFVELELEIAHASLQLADDPLATYDRVGFDFFEADGQVLKIKYLINSDHFPYGIFFLFTLTSISSDFLMASILTILSCSSCKISTVCLSSTCRRNIVICSHVLSFLMLTNIYLDALVSLVADSQFLGDFIVIGSNGGQFLFDLTLAAGQVHVDDGQFVDACLRFFILLLNNPLGAQSLQKKLFK